MKKLIPVAAAGAVAISMTLWQGCGTEEDPNAKGADQNEEVLKDEDPEKEFESKGEKNQPKPRQNEDPGDENPEG